MKKLLTFFAMVVAMLATTIDARGDTAPDALYLVGDISGNSWNTTSPIEPTGKYGNIYVFQNVTFTKTDNDKWDNQFTFITVKGSGNDPWNVVNSGDRYGANVDKGATEWMDLNDHTTKTLKKFTPDGENDDNSQAATNFRVETATYDIVLNFADMTITLLESSSYTPPNRNRPCISRVVRSMMWSGICHPQATRHRA